MPEPLQLTEAEIKLIIRKITPVKQAGFGTVLIRVQNGVIVYIEQSIGEQVKMELKT